MPMEPAASERQATALAALEQDLAAMIERLVAALRSDAETARAGRDAFVREATFFRHRLMAFIQDLDRARRAHTEARQAAEIALFVGDHEQNRLQDLHAKAMHWNTRFGAIRACLDRMFTAERRPLFPEALPRDDLNARTIARLADTVLMLDYYANGAVQHPEMDAYGGFPDIRLSPVGFLEEAHAAYRMALAQGRGRDISFLDVGCGGGVKVLMATHYFRRCEGIELDPGYADAARALFARFSDEDCRVHEEDALTAERYGEFDVVYFFQPMRNEEKLQALERRICETVRPGTLLIAPYHGFTARAETLGCQRVAGRVYVRGIDAAGAEALAAEAERMGSDTRPRQSKTPWEAVWTPLVEACLDRGFAP